ncbi:MAG: hypothetical protein QF426_02470 [Verrucomicrobiales bacterium]|jgi:hypothetical protein|nr:hypothetical protein [Verrucomicrobiales bacterium]
MSEKRSNRFRPPEQNEPNDFLAEEEISDDFPESQRKKSQAFSLGIAVFVHVVIFSILAFIVIANFDSEEIEMIVEASSSNADLVPEKRSFAKKVTLEKPAPPSRRADNTITATNASSIVMPEITTFSDTPAFGNDFGDGFGIGGFGDGRGGAKFFGTSGGGNRIILVIDTSTSMNNNCGPNGIRALRREIVRTLAALSPNISFNIICFGKDCDGFAPQPVKANSGNIARAKTWMNAYFINKRGGGAFDRTRTSEWGTRGADNNGIKYTPILPGAVQALAGTSGSSRMDLALVAAFFQKPSSVFLIADGEPGTSKNGQKLNNTAIVDLVLQEAKRIYTGSRLPKVNCISVKGIGQAILKDIARRFGGNYKAVDPAKV